MDFHKGRKKERTEGREKGRREREREGTNEQMNYDSYNNTSMKTCCNACWDCLIQ